MEDRRTISLTMSSGESRQILLEAGSTVLVVGGQLVLRRPMLWLAEHLLAPEMLLVAEQAWVAEEGGWVTLLSHDAALCVIILPGGVSFWQEVGACLHKFFGLQKRENLNIPPLK